MQYKKNNLGDRIPGILAISFTCFMFMVFGVILFRQTKTDNNTTMVIVTTIANMEFMILGFYFVSSKSNKDKDKQIEDLIQKSPSIENIEKVNINTSSNENEPK